MKLKKIVFNYIRAGILLIPQFGSGIEKALFGLSDEKAKEDDHKELLNAIREQNKQIQTEIQDCKDIRIIFVNIISDISKDEICSLFDKIGALQPKIIDEENLGVHGEQLLNSAVQNYKLSKLKEELSFLYPDSLEKPEKNANETLNETILRELAAASRPLLTWPTTVGKDKWLGREEANLIEDRISSNEASITLILGKPGTGKSALLSFVARILIEKGFPVLGIKADMLPRSVTDLHKLQEYLCLSNPIAESLIGCIADKPPILIIDQLDALSELVDRNSERLNVLLNLIHSVAKTNKVHVVSSCRWFEYQHDVRLTTIDAERIDLTLPHWEEVEIVLKEAGFTVENIPEETKNLCSVPFHLKMLLDLKASDASSEIPTSFQSLLEKIWRQRVLTGDNASNRVDLIEHLSNKMEENEELWVASAFADKNPVALHELQCANILKFDDTELRVGFIHQTYFDFARARLFAKGEKSLTALVLDKQDGLFVRPILLRVLAYLREANPKMYSEELSKLWETEDLRSHIRDLLIDYISSVENPDGIELSCLLPLFEDQKQRYKALLSVSGSSGWFNAIKGTVIPEIMCEGAEFAHLFIPIFSRAFAFAKEEVLLLVRNYWFKDVSYDENILNLLIYLKDWNQEAVDIVVDIAKRHDSRYIPQLAEMVSQSIPELASKIIRADLDRRWDSAIKDESEYKPSPSPETDEAEKAIYEFNYSRKNIFANLLRRNQGWYDLAVIAETSPKPFIDHVWPWFVKIVEKIVSEPNAFFISYQRDSSLETHPERDGVSEDLLIFALKKSIVDLSCTQVDSFIEFFNANSESSFLAVQRLLSIGLLEIVETHPEVILDYLSSDPRRMTIGDIYDQHKYTKKLISAVVPHLNEDQIKSLEDLATNWTQYHEDNPEWPPEDKIKRRKWDRQDRLRILRAFPGKHRSEQLIRLIEIEERAFPMLSDCDSEFSGVHTVGSRMSHEQMSKAKDDDIINLFKELTDDTEWDHPKKRRDFIGGSIQASREFATFANESPERASILIKEFIPGQQERPAGMGIGGLLMSNYSPSADIFDLIDNLVKKGFSTSEFRRDVTNGLSERARRDKGLPRRIINLLEGWMMEDEHPKLDDNNDNDEKDTTDQSILWGGGGMFMYPGGRDLFVQPIALGYLAQEIPEYSGFAAFIEKMLKHEKHPKVWQITFHWMKFLFDWDIEKATQYYNQVLRDYPDIAEDKIGIIAFGDILQLIPENPIVQDWLMQIGSKDSVLSKQAFGELLMLYNFRNPDDQWGREQLEGILNNSQFLREQRGVAFAASHNWHHLDYQSTCTEVLTRLSTTEDEITQRAISNVFLHNEIVPIKADSKRFIETVINNDGILVKSAERIVETIIDYTKNEPNIVAKICSRVIEVGKNEIENMGSHYSFVAEPIVSIALTLHRMECPYREMGLVLFEKLIESDIPYARQALSILDNKPLADRYPMRMRRRRKKRRK